MDQLLARSLQQQEVEWERRNLAQARATLADDTRRGRRGLEEPPQHAHPSTTPESCPGASQPDISADVQTETHLEGDAEGSDQRFRPTAGPEPERTYLPTNPEDEE